MYTFCASDRTIGRTVDCAIGENLSVPVLRGRRGTRSPESFSGQRGVPRGSLTAADIKKNHIQFRRGMRFYTQMKKNGQLSRGDRVIDFAAAAMEQMELYC